MVRIKKFIFVPTARQHLGRSAPTRCPLVQGYEEALEKFTRHKEVSLLRVPGHTWVPGNEKADELARLGAREPCLGPEPILETTRKHVTTALNE